MPRSHESPDPKEFGPPEPGEALISEEERGEQEIAREGVDAIREIRREGLQAEQDGARAIELTETRAKIDGMAPEAIEAIRRETRTREQLDENQRAIRELTERTTQRIEALVEILANSSSAEKTEAALKGAGVNPEPIGSGAFYDTLEMESNPDDPEMVLKVMKLNYLFNPDQAARMLARHALEAERLRENFGPEFVPQTAFILSEKYKPAYQAELERITRNKIPLYDFATFIKIQVDRKLQERYARRDVAEKRRGVDVLFGKLGQMLKGSSTFRHESAGVMIEERVRGITFHELMERGPRGGNTPHWEKLKANAERFIERLRTFNETYAFLWHRFDSDNVVIETDEDGEPTGEIKILDLNFTERSHEMIRKKLAVAMEERMIKPLEAYFAN